uniref:Secreted protein n=1 Tax=Panstrongylus lignarius TaxID=156445 RepID=A0A224Y3I0_9HEMI
MAFSIELLNFPFLLLGVGVACCNINNFRWSSLLSKSNSLACNSRSFCFRQAASKFCSSLARFNSSSRHRNSLSLLRRSCKTSSISSFQPSCIV